MLDIEEERILAKRWHKRKDRKAAHKLVTSHLIPISFLLMNI